MRRRMRNRDSEGEPPRALPPTADQVVACPPHYWLIANGWQECKKCWARQREVLPTAQPASFPARRPGAAPRQVS